MFDHSAELLSQKLSFYIDFSDKTRAPCPIWYQNTVPYSDTQETSEVSGKNPDGLIGTQLYYYQTT